MFIDNIFIMLPTNNTSQQDFFWQLVNTYISDHLPNFCIIEGNDRPRNEGRPMISFCNQQNFSNFIQAFESMDTTVPGTSGVNRSYNELNEIIQMYHNLYFPLERMSRKCLMTNRGSLKVSKSQFCIKISCIKSISTTLLPTTNRSPALTDMCFIGLFIVPGHYTTEIFYCLKRPVLCKP